MLKPTIGNINHTLCINRPGVCQVFFVPLDEVISSPDLVYLMMNSSAANQPLSRSLVELKTDNWHSFVNDFTLLGNYSYDDKVSAQGQFTNHKVTLPIPHDLYENNVKTFTAMRDRQFLVFIMLKDKSCRLLGSMERGCDFDRKFNSGTYKKSSINDLTFAIDMAQIPLQFKNPFVDELLLEHTVIDYDCVGSFIFQVNVSSLTAPTVLTIQYFDLDTQKWIDIQDVVASTNGLLNLSVTPFVFADETIYYTRAKANTLGIISNTLKSNPTESC